MYICKGVPYPSNLPGPELLNDQNYIVNIQFIYTVYYTVLIVVRRELTLFITDIHGNDPLYQYSDCRHTTLLVHFPDLVMR